MWVTKQLWDPIDFNSFFQKYILLTQVDNKPPAYIFSPVHVAKCKAIHFIFMKYCKDNLFTLK